MDSTAKTKAAESLLLTLVSVRVLRLSVSVHEQDCGPASSCPKKPECDLMQTSEVKLRIIQGHRRFSPESELGTHTIHSCPHTNQVPPYHHTANEICSS